MSQLALLPTWEPVQRPAVRHFGSKWKIAKAISRAFPSHRTYTEVFAGSASVLLRKIPAEREVISDLNGGTINFFRVLQTQPSALIDALQRTPKNRNEFYGCFESHPDPLEWARRYACLGWGGYIGAGGRWSGGCSEERLARLRAMNFEFLRGVSLRLRDTVIQQGEALAALGQYDAPDTLHYVDPPYPKEARASRDNRCQDSAPRRQYAHEMLDASLHEALAERLHSLQGQVVLSGRDCPLYEQLFGDWRKITFPVRDSSRKAANEVIWMNFE